MKDYYSCNIVVKTSGQQERCCYVQQNNPQTGFLFFFHEGERGYHFILRISDEVGDRVRASKEDFIINNIKVVD